MHITITNKNQYKTGMGNGLLVMLSIFLVTFYVYRDLGISAATGWIILLGLCIINMALRVRYHSFVSVSKDKLCFIAIVVVIGLCLLRVSSRHDANEMLYTLAMIVIAILVVLSEPSLSEIKTVFRIFKTFSFLIAIWIIFFKIFPSLYWASVYQFIDESCQELAAHYVPRGYGIPIGGSFTIGYYIMTVGLFIAAIVFLNNREIYNVKTKLWNGFYILVILLAMIAEGRRGELLSVLFALAFLFMISKNAAHFYAKLIAVIILISVVALTYQSILDYLKDIAFFHRYIITIEGLLKGTDITSGRIELWKTAIALFLSRPLFGIGFGGFAYHVSNKFRAIHGQDVMDAHNGTLQLLCETGIVGFLLILVPMIIIFVRTYEHLIRTKRIVCSNDNQRYACYVDEVSIGIQLFFFVLSQLDPSFYKPVFWGFYGLAVLLMYAGRKLLIEGNNYGP